MLRLLDLVPLRSKGTSNSHGGSSETDYVPDTISEAFFPFSLSLRQTQRADLCSRGQYVHSIKLFKAENGKTVVYSTIFRSQAKTESSHEVNITIDTSHSTVSDAFCTCKTG